MQVFFRKAWRQSCIRILRHLTTPLREKIKWDMLRDAFKGQRAFLIGNGPSLNRTPLYLLKDEHLIVFNRFYLMYERLGWRPDMYMCVDAVVAKDIYKDINKLIPDIQYAFFPDIHPEMVDFRKYICSGPNVYWLQPDFKGFYWDLPRVGMGGTVAYPALQVLIYMGFSPIYLIGVDMDYKLHRSVIRNGENHITSTADDDPNHFDPRYFGKGRQFHQPNQIVKDNMIRSLEGVAENIQGKDVQILNAGIGGCLQKFPRINFYDLFHHTEEESLSLMLEPLRLLVSGKDPVDLFQRAKKISGKTEFRESEKLVRVPIEEAIPLIKTAIFTHIPLGPHNNEYLFVKRKK